MNIILTTPDWNLEYDRIELNNSFPPEHTYPYEQGRVELICDDFINRGITSGSLEYNELLFLAARHKIHSLFQVPWTTFSRPLERLLYCLPRFLSLNSILVVGCGWGVAMGFLAAGMEDLNVSTPFKRDKKTPLILGVDVNFNTIEQAYLNINALSLNNTQTYFQQGDFCYPAIDEASKFDLVFLDADGTKETEMEGKKIYNYIVKLIYPYIRDGGFLVTHDTRWASKQLSEYFDFVRNQKNFTQSIEILLDIQGIEFSQKNKLTM